MHPRSVGLQHVDRPVPPVRCFQHHLGVGAGVLKLQSQRDRVINDPHRPRAAHRTRTDARSPTAADAIDPNELLAVILVHRDLP